MIVRNPVVHLRQFFMSHKLSRTFPYCKAPWIGEGAEDNLHMWDWRTISGTLGRPSHAAWKGGGQPLPQPAPTASALSWGPRVKMWSDWTLWAIPCLWTTVEGGWEDKLNQYLDPGSIKSLNPASLCVFTFTSFETRGPLRVCSKFDRKVLPDTSILSTEELHSWVYWDFLKKRK